MNKKEEIKHYIVGDIMFYFIINVLMYLVMLLIIIKYFKKMDLISFIIILFNMNIYVIFLEKDLNFLYGLMISILSIVFYKFINLFKKDNQDIILVHNGNINFHELINNYSYSKLANYLKRHKINLDEIEYCIKNNNHLTVIKNKDINSYPVSIILDGKLLNENLKLIHKSEDWLKEELLKEHLLINMVNYAYYKNNRVYFVKV